MKLKPCPFCDGEAEVDREGTSRVSCIVVCTNCGCRLESNEQGAGRWWNDRPAPTSPRAEGEIVCWKCGGPTTLTHPRDGVDAYHCARCNTGSLITPPTDAAKISVPPETAAAAKAWRESQEKMMQERAKPADAEAVGHGDALGLAHDVSVEAKRGDWLAAVALVLSDRERVRGEALEEAAKAVESVHHCTDHVLSECPGHNADWIRCTAKRIRSLARGGRAT